MERHLADLLSLSRIFLALYLVWSGLVDGKANLAQDVWILVLAWSTDIIDGRVARALTPGRQSWLGSQDVYIDMFFSVAALAFLMLTGLLPLGIGLGYLLVWLAVLARFGLPPMLAQFFQNPIYAAFLYFTVQSAPQMIPWLLLWALIAGILFGSRMLELLQSVWANFLGWLRRR